MIDENKANRALFDKKMEATNKIDDGLVLPEVGIYAEKKYRLIAHCIEMFSTSMKAPKWDCLVYIDLFSGAGKAVEKGTGKLIDGSPLLSLGVPHQFNRYIFCELEKEKFDALRWRVKQKYPKANAQFILGDCNDCVNEILAEIPHGKKGFRVLSFCVADIYKIANLKFKTIEKLSQRFMDFLVLIPTHMDIHRNEKSYGGIDNQTIDEFLGTDKWRMDWEEAKKNGEAFGWFICRYFYKRMKELKYLGDKEDAEKIRQIKNQSPLYHLTFFSKNSLGIKFWNEARKYSTDQTTFPF